MSIKDAGGVIVKYWAPVTGIIGFIAISAIAYSQLNDVRDRVQGAEARFQRIEWYLVKIGTKMGVEFDR